MDLFPIWVWLLLIVLVIAALWGESVRKQKEVDLMTQCQADGHKEYECVGMLRDNRPSTMVVPMVFPVR